MKYLSDISSLTRLTSLTFHCKPPTTSNGEVRDHGNTCVPSDQDDSQYTTDVPTDLDGNQGNTGVPNDQDGNHGNTKMPGHDNTPQDSLEGSGNDGWKDGVNVRNEELLGDGDDVDVVPSDPPPLPLSPPPVHTTYSTDHTYAKGTTDTPDPNGITQTTAVTSVPCPQPSPADTTAPPSTRRHSLPPGLCHIPRNPDPLFDRRMVDKRKTAQLLARTRDLRARDVTVRQRTLDLMERHRQLASSPVTSSFSTSSPLTSSFSTSTPVTSSFVTSSLMTSSSVIHAVTALASVQTLDDGTASLMTSDGRHAFPQGHSPCRKQLRFPHYDVTVTDDISPISGDSFRHAHRRSGKSVIKRRPGVHVHRIGSDNISTSGRVASGDDSTVRETIMKCPLV